MFCLLMFLFNVFTFCSFNYFNFCLLMFSFSVYFMLFIILTSIFFWHHKQVAPPFRVVELDILFGSGIDTYGCLLDAAESVGVVERKGSWYNRGETRFAQGSVFTYRPYHWPIIIIIFFYTNNVIFNSNKIIKRIS